MGRQIGLSLVVVVCIYGILEGRYDHRAQQQFCKDHGYAHHFTGKWEDSCSGRIKGRKFNSQIVPKAPRCLTCR
jgi:hypothetical protein